MVTVALFRERCKSLCCISSLPRVSSTVEKTQLTATTNAGATYAKSLKISKARSTPWSGVCVNVSSTRAYQGKNINSAPSSVWAVINTANVDPTYNTTAQTRYFTFCCVKGLSRHIVLVTLKQMTRNTKKSSTINHCLDFRYDSWVRKFQWSH